MRYVILAAALALAACSTEGVPNWPELQTLYRVDGAAVVCDSTTERTDAPLEVTCVWEHVMHEGEPHCYAIVVFSRDAESAPWTDAVFTSSSTCY
jgi:hypothetical protein